MNVEQFLIRETDALAQMVAAYLVALTSRSRYLSENGRRLLDHAYQKFHASSGETPSSQFAENR